MSTLGIIDLGTNSLRLDVLDVSQPLPVLLHREKNMVKLGENAFLKNQLTPVAMKRTLEALQDFSLILSQNKITHLMAYATSALRDSKNKNAFIKKVYQKTGIPLKLLSGEKEAELIARAILKRETKAKNAVLIDIGGGSTEITLSAQGKIKLSKSLPLGAARLRQLYLQKAPPKATDILELKKFIEHLLKKSFAKVSFKSSHMMGSSGTVKGVYQIMQELYPGPSAIELKNLTKLNTQMSLMNKDELAKLPGMELKRVDLMLAGSIALEEVAHYFQVTQIDYTPVALRDGLLDEFLKHRSRYQSKIFS